MGVPVAAATFLAAPVLAALGSIAALVTECTIEVEKVEDASEEINTDQGKTNGKEEK